MRHCRTWTNALRFAACHGCSKMLHERLSQYVPMMCHCWYTQHLKFDKPCHMPTLWAGAFLTERCSANLVQVQHYLSQCSALLVRAHVSDIVALGSTHCTQVDFGTAPARLAVYCLEGCCDMAV
jgi:hypothetical protein